MLSGGVRSCGMCWQTALGVSEGEVESWVVQAIGKKLLEARIDQLQRRITVTRAAHRAFGAGQWQELHTQLSAWAVRGATSCCTLC